MKGLLIPEMTVEKFRNECFESIEALIAEDEIFNIDYDPRHIPAIRDKLWEIQQCSNCILKPEKKIVEIKPQWIPVTERLPEYNVNVLCFCKDFWDGHCEVLQRERLNWFRGVKDTDRWIDPQSFGDEYVRDYTIDYVTAWMELPEPYRPEEVEE